MALQALWYQSMMPQELVDVIENDLSLNYDGKMMDSRLAGEMVTRRKRSSQNAWVETTHWVSGLVWHYVNFANQQNFMFDIDAIDGNTVQYTKYEEGEFYNWHTDAWLEAMYNKQTSNYNDVEASGKDMIRLGIEKVRKLSCIIQLSDPHDYEGGNVQMMDDTENTFFVPRQRGTVVVFDSRTKHRVNKIRSGTRKSIVAWALGPRWK